MWSQSVATTGSPGRTQPRMAMFRASVALAVKTTRSGESLPRSRASETRAWATVRAAPSSASPAPLPELPRLPMASTTASATHGGRSWDVAAQLR